MFLHIIEKTCSECVNSVHTDNRLNVSSEVQHVTTQAWCVLLLEVLFIFNPSVFYAEFCSIYLNKNAQLQQSVYTFILYYHLLSVILTE